MKQPLTPPRAIARHIPAIATLIAIIAITHLDALSLQAQTRLDTAGRWEPLDMGLHSQFGDSALISSIFFRDSMNGFLRDPTNGITFVTSDGGANWSAADGDIPIPHTLLADGFGFGTGRRVTYDGGATWSDAIILDIADSTLAGFKPALETIGFASRNLWLATAEYDTSYYDSFAQKMIYADGLRLLLTTDGGAHWRPLDSVALGQWGPQQKLWVQQPTLLGSLPHPDSIPNARVGWKRVTGRLDSTTLYVISFATWTEIPAYIQRTRYYLGTINLRTLAAEWHELPTGKDVDPINAVPGVGTVTVLNGGLLKHDANYLSTDGGASWQQIQLTAPSWVALDAATILSRDTIIAPNAISVDGGLTWEARPNFLWADAITLPMRSFAVVTPTHYVMIAAGALYAESFDAGRTWRRNHGFVNASAIAARNGHVVVGWEGRAITRSTDAGASWSDIGDQSGELPEGLAHLYTMSYLNDGGTDRLIGVAAIADTLRSVRIIRSSDGGATWEAGMRLLWYESYLILNQPIGIKLQFVQAPAASGSAQGRMFLVGWDFPLISDDGGTTWTMRGDAKLQRIAMGDDRHGVGVVRSGDTAFFVYATTDGGNTWVRRSDYIPDTFIDIDAIGPLEYRILTAHGERRTSDGGLTWSLSYYVSEPRGGGWLRRISDSNLYLLTTDQWLYSSDAGRTYQVVKQGLRTNASTGYSSAISASDPDYIYVGGSGKLMARWRLAGSAAVDRSDAMNATARLAENVVRGDRAMLRLQLDAPATVGLRVVDMLGREVREERKEMIHAGAHAFEIDLAGLPGGRYLVAVTVGGKSASLPLLLVR